MQKDTDEEIANNFIGDSSHMSFVSQHSCCLGALSSFDVKLSDPRYQYEVLSTPHGAHKK